MSELQEADLNYPDQGASHAQVLESGQEWYLWATVSDNCTAHESAQAEVAVNKFAFGSRDRWHFASSLPHESLLAARHTAG